MKKFETISTVRDTVVRKVKKTKDYLTEKFNSSGVSLETARKIFKELDLDKSTFSTIDVTDWEVITSDVSAPVSLPELFSSVSKDYPNGLVTKLVHGVNNWVIQIVVSDRSAQMRYMGGGGGWERHAKINYRVVDPKTNQVVKDLGRKEMKRIITREIQSGRFLNIGKVSW